MRYTTEIRHAGNRLRARIKRGSGDDEHARRLARLERQLRQARRRISALEDDVQEARRLNKRIAELTDLVAEVLLSEDRRDDAAVRSRLKAYRDSVAGGA
ncbi:MAG TPA: DUF6752 domain-containing protein [Marmoricola sp.]|nr:DUF6752 domain-containing protein [Marmoricola sp.]